MRPRRLALLLSAALVAGLGAVPAVAAGQAVPDRPGLLAGFGRADASGHVGAGSGQYAAKDPNALSLVQGDDVDPYAHGTTQRVSYGVQSRLTTTALVLRGTDGGEVALVKTDLYLAQDMLQRRIAQLLAEGDSGIGYDELVLSATHNHSSPYYTTPAAGVWAFQDAADLRAFEDQARQAALAVERAADALVPARMGATVVPSRVYKGNIAGPTVTDDGSPGGYPDTWADAGMTVLRVDDVSDPGRPRPLAAYVNHGQHPESLDGHDLITADYLAPFQRMVEEDLGAPVVFSQGDVGSAEGPYLRSGAQVLPDGVVRAWAHVGHAQTERGARYLADDVVSAWEAIGRGDVAAPLTRHVPVRVLSTWVPGPVSHPYPSVSNCRSEPTAAGDPGAPVLGLPDCARGGLGPKQSAVVDRMRQEGIPVPEHYDAPSAYSVQENARIRLQAVRLGEVLLASCSCEAQMDLVLNLESRADRVAGNVVDGYDWAERCGRDGGAWSCDLGGRTVSVSDGAYRRMRAQVRNDARGWDDLSYAPFAGSEPADPELIKGNFTKEELPPSLGYAVPVALGHTGDYTGYTVSYREYMSRDHYRKALTSYGPHTADYMVTRLVRMAGALKGGPPLAPEPHDTAALADEARQQALALALGRASSAALDAFRAGLSDDRGPVAALVQPQDVQRFGAATFTWRGGSTAVDNPLATVERRVGDRWEPYGDMTGEVQTMVALPRGAQGAAGARTAQHEWRWTAQFEAFDAFPRRVVEGGQVPDGEYRFVVEGHSRQGGSSRPYRLESAPFRVSPWQGLQVTDVETVDGRAVFTVPAPRYPRTYASPFRYVRDDGGALLCKTCSFRPWASSSDVASVTLEVLRDGVRASVPARPLGDDRWELPRRLVDDELVRVPPGGVRDAFGETNGAPSGWAALPGTAVPTT